MLDFVSGEKNKQNIELCVWCSGRMKLIFDKLRGFEKLLDNYFHELNFNNISFIYHKNYITSFLGFSLTY